MNAARGSPAASRSPEGFASRALRWQTGTAAGGSQTPPGRVDDPCAATYDKDVSVFERRPRIPTGLAERIERVRGNEPFEHWIRHQLEGAVLACERALGLVSERQRDQVETQSTALEQLRDQAPLRSDEPDRDVGR